MLQEDAGVRYRKNGSAFRLTSKPSGLGKVDQTMPLLQGPNPTLLILLCALPLFLLARPQLNVPSQALSINLQLHANDRLPGFNPSANIRANEPAASHGGVAELRCLWGPWHPHPTLGDV